MPFVEKPLQVPLVISAFEAFGGRTHNRTVGLAEQLVERQRASFLGLRVLPVRFAALGAAIDEVVALNPKRWLMLGESSKSDCLVVERLAANDISARIPDNDGAQPQAQLVEAGPPQRRSEVEVEVLVKDLLKAEVRAAVSDDAGRYVCNAAYYLALARMEPTRVLFVHVPDDSSKMPNDILMRGLERLLLRWSVLDARRR